MLFVPFCGYLPVGCFYRDHVRERGVAGSVERTHAITITRVCREPGVRKTRDVSADLRYLREVRAVLTCTPFDPEALLVCRVVTPRQVDLSRRYGSAV